MQTQHNSNMITLNSIITPHQIRCRLLCKISCHPFLKIFVNLISSVCSFINTWINVSSLVTEPLYLKEDIIKMFWHRKGDFFVSSCPPEVSVKHVACNDKQNPCLQPWHLGSDNWSLFNDFVLTYTVTC